MSFKAKINTAWKLKEESVQDYNRFLNFRDRVPRISLEEYAGETGLSKSRTYTISSKYKWTERIQAYDLENEQSLQEQNRSIANEVKLNQLKTYKLLQEKILQRLSDLDAGSLSPGQLSMFLKNLDIIENKLTGTKGEEDSKSDTLLKVLAESLKGGQR